MTRTRHMGVRGNADREPEFFCDACKTSYTARVPIPISLVVALCKAFEKEHAGCADGGEHEVSDSARST